MSYLMYDRFLESYSKIPKQTQTKVRSMLVKLREPNPRSSLNLEHIHSFRDQNMMTVRVDDAYRAIIYVFSNQSQYAVLWVDHHDDAMRWAEKKQIVWNGNNQTIQIFEAEIESALLPKAVETRETQGAIGSCSDEELLAIGVPEVLLPSVKAVSSFEDLEKVEKYIPKDAFENLFALLDGKPVKEIIEETQEGTISSTDTAEQLGSPNNLRNFLVVKDESDLETVLESNYQKWKVFLHPAQRKYSSIDFPGSYKVTGAAGTGKTVLALHRLKYLIDSKKVCGRVLFTTYTKSLVCNLTESVKELNIDPLKVRLTNIHNLIFEMAKEYKLIPSSAKPLDIKNSKDVEKVWNECTETYAAEFDIDFLIREYHQVVLLNNIWTEQEYLKVSRIGMNAPLSRKERLKVWMIFEHFKKNRHKSNEYYIDEAANLLVNYLNKMNLRPFDHVVADEVQDLSIVDLRFLRALVEMGPNDLFLVGDPLQNIYGKNNSFIKAGINIRGVRSRKLRINYRTTEEIKRSAVSVIKGQEFNDFEGNTETINGYVSLLKGEEPQYWVYNNKTSMESGLLNILSDLLSSANVELSEICIAARIKENLNDVRSILHKKYNYFDLAASTGSRNGVTLSTMHNLKGLEYKVVILYNISKTTFPFYFFNFTNLEPSEKKSYLRSERALMYVSMTRAIKKLYILGVSEPCDWLKDKAEML